MNLETTYELDGVTLTARNTARQSLRVRLFADWAQAADGSIDEDLRTSYFWIASYGVRLTGARGVKLPEGADDIEACYQAMLDTVTREWFYGASSAILAMVQPFANAVEKPDGTLTEAEKADPNS